jgi:hypothetical protein
MRQETKEGDEFLLHFSDDYVRKQCATLTGAKSFSSYYAVAKLLKNPPKGLLWTFRTHYIYYSIHTLEHRFWWRDDSVLPEFEILNLSLRRRIKAAILIQRWIKDILYRPKGACYEITRKTTNFPGAVVASAHVGGSFCMTMGTTSA